METNISKSIEVDGISEEFFHLLWSKDELNFGPSINIPDTVIFKYGQPVTWFFTASNGKIKKKNRNNLLNARIEDVFTKNVLGYDVIATFISFGNQNNNNNGNGNNHEHSGQGKGIHPNNTIEYLDRKEFQRFLYERFESNSGILQKFVEPKGTKNETIRAIWSPKVCLLERAENIYQLHDHRYGLYERCVTYEGPEFYCTSAPLRGPVLAGQVQRICESIVAHISEVTFAQNQVSRIVLNFKVDSRDKVWLLYSTSIRCSTPPTVFGQEPTPNPLLVNIDNVLSLPSTVYLNPNRSYDKIKPKKEIQCLSCGCKTLEDIRHPMQYKTIIKHYEHVLFLIQEMSEPGEILRWPPKQDIIDSAGGVGFGCLNMPTSSGDDHLSKPKKMDLTKPLEVDELRIPPIIRYIHPKLSARSYQQCRKDPLFLYKSVMLCENCYLIYAEFTTMLLKIGSDLTKLFTKTDGTVYDRTISSPQKGRNNTIGNNPTMSTMRPSSADWRALSTANSNTKLKPNVSSSSIHQSSYSTWSSQLNPSENHIIAKENSIGLRSNEPVEIRTQPNIPSTIRNKIDSVQLIVEKRNENYQSLSSQPNNNNNNNNNNNKSGYTDEDLRQMIANRERHFYKEISKNPQLRDQHPLMHLINSQQKLLLADEQSGVLNLNANSHSQSEKLYNSSYGQQNSSQLNNSNKDSNKFLSYKQPIQFYSISSASINGNGNGKVSKQSPKKKKFVSGNRSLASYASSSTALSNNSSVDNIMNESIKKHNEFLNDTLQLIEKMDIGNKETNIFTEAAGVKAALIKTKLDPINDSKNKSNSNNNKKKKHSIKGPIKNITSNNIGSVNSNNSNQIMGTLSPSEPNDDSESYNTTPNQGNSSNSSPRRIGIDNNNNNNSNKRPLSRHDFAIETTDGIMMEGMNRAVKDIIESEEEDN